jgi:hypothetical protein
LAALTTEVVLGKVFKAAKFAGLRIFGLAFRALHLTPPGEIGGKDYLWIAMETAVLRKEINGNMPICQLNLHY